jgi:hypothetical protein
VYEQRKYVERASVRHLVHIPGKVVAPDLSRFVDCIVRDISADGAMAKVPLDAELPSKVYLWQAKTWTFFECDVKWRKPGQIGLHFVDVASRSKSRALMHALGLCQPSSGRTQAQHGSFFPTPAALPTPSRQAPWWSLGRFSRPLPALRAA